MKLVKERAARSGRTLTAVIEDALRTYLTATARPSRKRAVRLATVGGKGLQPGVDLDSSAALHDLMDRDDATR